MMGSRSLPRVATGLAVLAVGVAVLVGSAGSTVQPTSAGDPFLYRSQAPQVSYWAHNPTVAPARFADALQQLESGSAWGSGPPSGAVTVPSVAGVLFNQDNQGLPQNEEAIDVCGTAVLGGTNDYRGLLFGFNLGGWELSTNAGASVTNDGLLPGVTIVGTATPSGGDPNARFDSQCNPYMANIDYTFKPNGDTKTSAVVVYRNTIANLTAAGCTFGAACGWDAKLVDKTTTANEFLDKEWMDVGVSGQAGEVVWITYTDFFGSKSTIKGVRCNLALTVCTAPIPISIPGDALTQASYVTIGQDGAVYVSYVNITSGPDGQTFTIRMRRAPAGSTVFGPAVTVADVTKAIPFGGFLQADDFRVVTIPKNATMLVGGKVRAFVTYDECTFRLLTNICEESNVVVRFADVSDGVLGAFSGPVVVSQEGENYFPTIASDGVKLAAAYYTSRLDDFQHRNDVELVELDPATGAVLDRTIRTSPSNEPDADPFLGGFFIGDYVETNVTANFAYTHFNADYRQVPLLGGGIPVNQQDNFLDRVALP